VRTAGVAGALAALAIAFALQISSSLYDPRALALMVLAMAGAAVAAFARDGDGGALPVRSLLGAGAAAGLLFHVFADPTFYGDRSKLAGFRWLAATSLVLLSAYLCIHLRATLIRARFLLLLACFLVMGIAVLRASPKPWIDVWYLQQGASEALLHGVNPYTASYPDIYGRLSHQMYAPEVAHGGRVFGFPYPPLTFLAGLPAFAIFGDIRVSWLLAMAAAAWLLARAIGGAQGELAALFILFQPRSWFVLEQAWTEPLMLLTFAVVAFALHRRWPPALCGIALGALLASKQYAPLIAAPLFFVLPRGGRVRALAAAVATAAVVTVPFWIWNGAGFVRSVVKMHVWQPFRPDGLSLWSAWARIGAVPEIAGAVGLVVGAAILAVWVVVYGRNRGEVSLGRAAAASALVWIAVVLFSKQGFCNYYWLCAGLLGAGATARARGTT